MRPVSIFLSFVLSTFLSSAQAQEKTCGLQTLSTPEHRLELKPIQYGKFYPDFLAAKMGALQEGRYVREDGYSIRRSCIVGDIVDARVLGDRMTVITRDGHIKTYGQDLHANTDPKKYEKKCVPLDDQVVKGVRLKQVLRDSIVAELPDGTPAILDLQGKAVATPGKALQGARFLAEPTAKSQQRVAFKDNRFWVLDSKWKVVNTVTLDRNRQVLTSGFGWIAAYSEDLHNILVYGLSGERISSIDLPPAKWEISLVAGGGPILAVDLPQRGPRPSRTLHTYDPKTGVETGSAEVRDFSTDDQSHRYYEIEGEAPQIGQLSVVPTGKQITRIVNTPCDDEVVEEQLSKPGAEVGDGK